MDISFDSPDAEKRRPVFMLLGFAVLIYALAFFCISLTQHATALASLWFPPSVTISVLFHTPKRQWPAFLAVAALATMLASWSLLPLSWLSVQLPLINQFEALTGALLLTRLLNPDHPFEGLNDWLRFIACGVIFAPLLSALPAAFIIAGQAHTSFGNAFGVWFMSEATSIMALTPLGLLCSRGYLDRIMKHPMRFETLVTLILTLLYCYYAMRYLPFPFIFVIIPMLWAAIRLPLMEAFVLFLAVIFLLAGLMAYHTIEIRNFYPGISEPLLFTPLLLILIPSGTMAVLMRALRTERRHISESERLFRNMIEYSAIGTALVAPDGKWLRVNQALCQLLDYPAETLQRMTFQDITHPDDLESDLKLLQRLLSGEIDHYSLEKRYLSRNKQVIWVLLSVSLVRDPHGQPLHFLSQVKEITAQKNNERLNQELMARLYEEKERLHITLNAISNAVICTDQHMSVTFLNPVAEKMLGLSREQAEGRPIDEVVHLSEGVEGKRIENPLLCLGAAREHATEEGLILHGTDGRWFDVQSNVSALKDVNGELMGCVLVFQDVSESRELMRRLSYSALHDPLTGLPNRTHFAQKLKKAQQQAIEERRVHSLVFLDLDHFKNVNDSAGHAAGDELLRHVSQLMQSHIRPDDTLSRLGGDEFALILTDMALPQAQRLIETLVGQINDYRFHWEDRLYRIGASAGMTQISSTNAMPARLMSQADTACYTAKHSGRGQVVAYESGQKEDATSPLRVPDAAEIDAILDVGLLQPLLTITAPPAMPHTAAFFILEAEARRADGTQIPPDFFLRACIQHQKQKEVERRLLDILLQHYGAALKNIGISLAIPLSAVSLADAAFCHDLLALLDQSALPASRLLFIVKESVITDHTIQLRDTLSALKAKGCRLIVDEFGLNLGLLDQIKSLQIDYVIINRSLIANVHSSQMDEVMVSIINGSTDRNGIQTIAGPVDSEAKKQTLGSIGVNLIFGPVAGAPASLQEQLRRGYFGIN
ncbi:diguanylate cyclase domain-containing protein [Enterobacillus tribolii]|uniref:diguanylate cyclase n=1 Tax=Enterobacillus tribolii TaxID=1487935 RepID=A0A370QNB7_9GAMM|nr:diguanylate cyclase [Enterobacillus tribolii]MBW7982114.1 diguanylate cyclase [Enterobacillus tribolii]RDK89864.1 PAS domain S-box-containing protein/diguanylate cyclase (GGDEF)-like protein [Enterobacillus tribolii]